MIVRADAPLAYEERVRVADDGGDVGVEPLAGAMAVLCDDHWFVVHLSNPSR
jgi:hypothetical protein